MTTNIFTVIKNIPKVTYSVRTAVIASQKFSTKSIEHSNKAVHEAEKIVGYPTSFLSLRWLLNDEVANITLQLKKLIGTKHPLITTARDVILNKELPSWGLIVLLISKAGGFSTNYSQVDCDITAGILHSQRVLAEITEMIRTSNLIHKSILNISKDDEFIDDLHFGNKLSLLTGDYLLSSSFRELSDLKCHKVNELVSTSLRDLAEADFIEPRDRQNRPLPAPPLPLKEDVLVPNHFEKDILMISDVLGNAKAEWTLRHLLGGASLLGKCCQATLMLADHSKDLEESGYIFGRNIALALQIRKDISFFKSDQYGPFSFISAPLMFHIQENPEFYHTLMNQVEQESINYGKLRNAIKNGNGIQKALELQTEFVSNGLQAINKFPDNVAKLALMNILQSI